MSPGKGVRALAVAVLMLLIPIVARAHAYIIATSPAQGGRVTTPPREVDIQFDEPVTLESRDALVVRDSGGAVIPCAGGAHIDPRDATRLVCSFASRLARGSYTVAWRVTSADTHVVHGVFSFGVEVAAVAPAQGAAPGSAYDPSGPLATLTRWLTLVGVAALVGATLFERVVLDERAFRAQSTSALEVLRGCCTWLRAGGANLAIVAGVGALVVQTAAATGTDAARAVALAPTIVVGSIWGVAWLIRTCSLIIAALLAQTPPSLATLGLCGLVIATLSASGHAAASGSAIRAIGPFLADWLHAAAAAVWSGGLAVFAFGTRPALATLSSRGERYEFTSTVIARFSPIAIACVAVLAASGAYAVVTRVGSVTALTDGLYGRVILMKTALFFLLIAFGYANRRQGHEVRGGFARSASSAAAIALVVLFLSGLLGGLAQPVPIGGTL